MLAGRAVTHEFEEGKMGLNRTVTGLTHYDIQNRRRKAKHDEARAQQRYVIHRSDVELVETERGFPQRVLQHRRRR